MSRLVAWFAGLALVGCALRSGSIAPAPTGPEEAPYVVVLGIAQDAGFPHPGCERDCCSGARRDPSLRRSVSCVALVEPGSGSRWMLDATPDFGGQLHALEALDPMRGAGAAESLAARLRLSGVFLTHAHIGHYTGLMYLGREGIGARGVPVHAMPRMREFLAANGPWAQLVALGNIELRPLAADAPVALGSSLTVTPFLVPHRDELSETVGFVVAGPRRRVLYLPDIDKWERWDRGIEEVIAGVDRAYVDGTFFADGEVPGRSMKEIPHPFIEESLARFATLPAGERAKIRFIHLNHGNPALAPRSAARARIEAAGCGVAGEGERFAL